jgi:hypothetical protein
VPRGRTFDPEVKLEQGIDLSWRAGSFQELGDTLDLNRGTPSMAPAVTKNSWHRALTRYREQRKVHSPRSSMIRPSRRCRAFVVSPSNSPTPTQLPRRTNDHAPLRTWTLPNDRSTKWKTCCPRLSRDPREQRNPAASTPPQLARLLVVMLQGLHVYDRAMANPRRTRDPVDIAMSAIRSDAVVQSGT